ncbi:hypothetical protein SLA2020_098140 [Shorea laevis]
MRRPPWSSIPIKRRVESFADDLNMRRGIVSGRVALLPRSTEIQPFIASIRPSPPILAVEDLQAMPFPLEKNQGKTRWSPKTPFLRLWRDFPAPWRGRYHAVAREIILFSPNHGISQNPCIFPHASLDHFGR